MCARIPSFQRVLITTALDDPRVPIHLLVYAVQTAVTTATCIADYMSWSLYSNAEKTELGKLYVPYLAVCKLEVSFASAGGVNTRLICEFSGVDGNRHVLPPRSCGWSQASWSWEEEIEMKCESARGNFVKRGLFRSRSPLSAL